MTSTIELVVKAQGLVRPVPKIVNEQMQSVVDGAGILTEWKRVAPSVGIYYLPGDYCIRTDEKGSLILCRSFLIGGGEAPLTLKTEWALERDRLGLSEMAALSQAPVYLLRDLLQIPTPEARREYGPPKPQEAPAKPQEASEPTGAPRTVLKPEAKGGRPGQGFDSGVMRTPPPPMSEWELPEIQNNATTAPGEASSSGNGSDDQAKAAPPPAEGSTVVAPSQVQSEGEPSDYPGPASTPTPSEAAPVPPVVGPPSAGPFQCSRCSSVIRDDEIAMYDLEDDKAQEFPFCEECWETVGPLSGPDTKTEAALQDAASAFLGGVGEPVKAQEDGPKCDSCGKVCKDNRGLSAHKRKCQPREGPSEPQGKERDLRKNPEKGDAPKFLGITYEVLHVEGSKLQIRKVSSPGGVQSVVDEPWSLARWRAFWKKRTPDPANVPLVKESDNVVSEGLAPIATWKDESP